MPPGSFVDHERKRIALEESEVRYRRLFETAKDGILTLEVEFVSNVYLVNSWRVIQYNIRDITARKRAEARVQTTNDELMALVEELQWRDRELQLLNRMNELLLSCITVAEAYQVITLTAGDLFPGHDGGLAILRARDQPLEVVAR